jgi:hypothetical protein
VAVRLALRILVVTALVYLLVAYLVVPRLWIHYEHHPALAEVPKRTLTADGIPGDALNLALIGSEAEMLDAFALAGWRQAAALGLRADLDIGESVVLDRPDATAPVSSLFLFGRKQDLAFEQEIGRSARQRNHVRFWRDDERGDGKRPLWLGAATRDRSVGFSRTTGQITHHIASDIDAARNLVMGDLTAAGQLVETYQVTGVGPTLDGRNGGGDRYYTDGELDVGVLSEDNQRASEPPRQLPNPTGITLKNWAWSRMQPVLQSTSEGADDVAR